MLKLTDEQRAFLSSQKLSIDHVFDGSGLRKVHIQAAMERTGQRFYLSDGACKSGGHTLRSKAGHCIQCDTSRIAFVMRPSEPAYVYIVGSLKQRFVKIGSTIDLATRLTFLTSQAYGGASDWELLAKAFTKKAGTVEFDAQAKLTEFRTAGEYEKGGHTQEAYELFRCPFSTAKKALEEALPVDVKLVVIGNEDRILLHYE